VPLRFKSVFHVFPNHSFDAVFQDRQGEVDKQANVRLAEPQGGHERRVKKHNDPLEDQVRSGKLPACQPLSGR
jgi:hypothetical protein